MIESVIIQEIDKIQIPTVVTITVSPSSKAFLKNRRNSSTSVDIDFGPPRTRIIDDLEYSYLDFWLNGKENIIQHVNYRLQGELQGKGYGRKLVEAMENAGRRLGFESIRIDVSTNDSFWEHMGYSMKGEYLEKRIN